jgi:hypothetical protein
MRPAAPEPPYYRARVARARCRVRAALPLPSDRCAL